MDNDREAPMGPFGWQSHLEVTRRLCKVAKIPGINHDVLGKPMPSVRKDGLNELRFLCGQIVDDFHSGKTEAAIATAVANEVPKIEAGTPPAVPPKPASKGKNIDARMLKVMADNLESHGWPARKWATHLNCNHSTICGTATWRGPLKTMQEIYKLNSIANRNKSPKSPRKTRQRSHG